MNSGNDLGNFLEVAKGVLARVAHIQEAVLVPVSQLIRVYSVWINELTYAPHK